MEAFISAVNFIFVIIGVAATVRFLVMKLTSVSAGYHYIVPLKDKDAEMTLRDVLEKNKFEAENRGRVIFAVDMGLDRETARACEMMSFDHPQIVFCLPEDLKDLMTV